MFLSPEKNICESISLISVSGVSQAQVECIQMNSLIIQEKQAMNVTSVLVKWQQKQLLSIYLQTSWWICNTGSITWDEMLYPMSINKEIHSSSFVMTACKVGVELFKKASHHKHVWKHAAGLEECLTPCRLFAIALEPLLHPCWITHYSFQDFAANKRNPKQFSSPLTFIRQMISEAHASGFQNIDVPYAQNFVLILTANADH